MTFSLLLGLTLLGAPAPTEAEPDEVVKDRKAFIPSRKHGSLKGKTTAVLVDEVKGYMAFDGRSGPPDAMGLSVSGDSYRWIYVPTPGAKNPLITNLQVPVGEQAGKKKIYPSLGMANPGLVKRWGIAVPYSLVEVEVNDGEGSPPEEGFVATKMTRLDGTRDYPLDVTKTVEALKKRYAADGAGLAKRVEAVLEGEGKKVLMGRKVTGPRETSQLMYLTWLPEKSTLRVAFRTKVTDGAYSEVEGGARPGPFPLPPPAGRRRPAALRFPPPPPPRFKVKTGVTFGVEFGFAYLVDRTGKVVKRQELKPEGFSQELAVPPGGRQRGPRAID